MPFLSSNTDRWSEKSSKYDGDCIIIGKLPRVFDSLYHYTENSVCQDMGYLNHIEPQRFTEFLYKFLAQQDTG